MLGARTYSKRARKLQDVTLLNKVLYLYFFGLLYCVYLQGCSLCPKVIKCLLLESLGVSHRIPGGIKNAVYRFCSYESHHTVVICTLMTVQFFFTGVVN